MAFEFSIPYEVYDLDIQSLNNVQFDEVIKSILMRCMNEDEYIYALDWKHTGFRYNPKSELPMQKCVHIEDAFGGYNVYFPDFYPDGDYYFFIAKDFRWGYLTHPWQRRCWVFGSIIMEEFEKHKRELNLQ